MGFREAKIPTPPPLFGSGIFTSLGTPQIAKRHTGDTVVLLCKISRQSVATLATNY